MSALCNKYAPATLDQVVFPSRAAEDVVRQAADNHCRPNLFLFGPPGTGKSTTMNLIADSLDENHGCAKWAVMSGAELGGADAPEKVIGGINQAINGTTGRLLVLIEEADTIPKRVQSALKLKMDQVQAYSQWIWTTNFPEKVEAALKDRFFLVDFTQHEAAKLLQHARRICMQERASFSEEELSLCVHAASGSIRKLNQLLEVKLSRLSAAQSSTKAA